VGQTKVYRQKLVGGFNPSEKYYEQSVGMIIILNIWKNKKMFQTTNQYTVKRVIQNCRVIQTECKILTQ